MKARKPNDRLVFIEVHRPTKPSPSGTMPLSQGKMRLHKHTIYRDTDAVCINHPAGDAA